MRWNDAFTNNLVTPDVIGRTHPRRGPRVSTATDSRCRTACWRSGRPTRRGASADPQDERARCQHLRSRVSAAAAPMPVAAMRFDTIKPGPVPDPDGKPQAPHLVLAVFARGMLLHLYTRIYFDGEAANAADPGAGAGARPIAAPR